MGRGVAGGRRGKEGGKEGGERRREGVVEGGREGASGGVGGEGAGDCPGAGSRQALMKGEGACFSALCKLEGCWSVELGSCAAG